MFQMEEQELSIAQQLERYPQRDLHKTHYFRMAQRCFGPAKLRVRRFIAAPLSSASTHFLRLKTIQVAVKKQAEKGVKELLEQETKEIEDEYTKWMRKRKKMRRELRSIDFLKYWLENKIFLTDMEAYVLEAIVEQDERLREEKAKLARDLMYTEPRRRTKINPTVPLILRPSPKAIMLLQQHLNKHRLRLIDFFKSTDKEKRWKLSKSNLQEVITKAQIPITDQELDDMLETLGKAGDLLYKDLAHGQKTWKREVRKEFRNQLYHSDRGFPTIILTTSYLTLIADRNPQLTPEPIPHINSSVESPLPTIKLSNTLQVPPIDVSEQRPFTPEEKILLKEWRLVHDKESMENKDYIEKKRQCLYETGVERAVACHCLLSTLKGLDGVATDVFRQQCLMEYHKLRRLCEESNTPLTEGLLERAMLHPGDTVLLGRRHEYRLRQPGTNVFSPEEIENWFTARERTLKDQLDQVETENGIEVIKTMPEQKKEALHLEQEVKEVGKKKEPTKTAKQITRKGNGKTKTKPKDIKTKVKPRPPLKPLPTIPPRKLAGKEKTKKTERNMTLDEYEKHRRRLRELFNRNVPWYIHANQDAFWPGHLLDKLRMYLPDVKLKHEEVLFSNTQQKPQNYPGYHNEITWPVSNQGYVMYGDINMRKVYSL